MQLRVCIDVDDLERGIAFYVQGLGLQRGRRLGNDWVELLGAGQPIDLLAEPADTVTAPDAPTRRTYARHWTPVHLDFVVDDLDTALERVLRAGARLERPVQERAWGRMANLADPFGHGFDLLQFQGRGYDELLAGQA